MATSFADLTQEVQSYLTSFGATRDKMTSLATAIGPTDLTLTVLGGRHIDRGYIEIDDELMAVANVDTTSGVVTLHPWGRGVRGTTAASHAQYAQVVDTPRFPNSRVKAEINKQILNMYPDLFQVSVDETNTASPVYVTYPLPASAESIVSVSVQTIGPSRMWMPITRYRMDYNADLTAFPTGKTLDIYAGMPPGRKIKVVYRQQFLQLVQPTDILADVGLDESWRDIVVMGAIGRILMGLDPARLELDSIESATRAQFVQPTQAISIARQYTAFAQQRVAEERRLLLNRYPSTQVRMS